MTVLAQKLAKLHFAAVVRLALTLFVVVFGAGAVLAQTNLAECSLKSEK
jgi:hypothetical protein